MTNVCFITACFCDPIGTANTSHGCSLGGICACKDGFAGVKCDRCSPTSLGIYPHCRPCTVCYQRLRSNLIDIENAVVDRLSTVMSVFSLPDHGPDSEEMQQLIILPNHADYVSVLQYHIDEIQIAVNRSLSQVPQSLQVSIQCLYLFL